MSQRHVRVYKKFSKNFKNNNVGFKVDEKKIIRSNFLHSNLQIFYQFSGDLQTYEMELNYEKTKFSNLRILT